MRLLFLLQPGKNSRSIFLDMIRGFVGAGHEWSVVELAELWRAHGSDPSGATMERLTENLARGLVEHRVDAVVGMWVNAVGSTGVRRVGGVPATVFDEVGVPCLNYWLDAPHWAHSGSVGPLVGQPRYNGPAMVHAINHESMASEMRAVLGMRRVHALPYGVSEEVFRPVVGVTPTFDVVMNVGPGDPDPLPEMLAALDSDDPPMHELRELAAARVARPGIEQSPALDAPGVREAALALVATQIADRHRPMLDRARDLIPGPMGLGISRLMADPRAWIAATSLVRQVDSWERAFTASWLSRRVSMAVVGDFSARWPFAGTRLGEVAYEALAPAYARGRVAMSVMRWQDDQGVNIKPLEMTACGVAALCGRRVGLEAILEPGREVGVFDGPREALALVRQMLGDQAARERLAQAGLERTRRDHTWTCRAGQLAGILEHARGAMRSAA